MNVGGFDPDLRLREDLDLFLSIARKCGAHYDDRISLHYRIGAPSLMHAPVLLEADIRDIDYARGRTQAKFLTKYGALELYTEIIQQNGIEGSMRVYVEALGDAREFSALKKGWEALDREIEPRTPFASPLWNRLWWKHFRRERLWTKDHLFVHIIRDDEGKLRAVVPLILVFRPAFGPSKLRVLRFFGADAILTEVRGVICRRNDETAVFQALGG